MKSCASAGKGRRKQNEVPPHCLCVFCGLLVHAHALDREAFTFTKYDLDVRIEPEQQRLAVRGKITLRNDSASPQKNLCPADFFHAGLAIDSGRGQTRAVCFTALHLGHRSHRRAFGSCGDLAQGDPAKSIGGVGNWIRGHYSRLMQPG